VSVLLGALLWLLAQVGSLYREVGRLARTDKGTCSIGVATWDRREEATALVARALYAAKKGGRNRSCADPAEAAEPVARAQG
jgi:PleD family two-component response regulator